MFPLHKTNIQPEEIEAHSNVLVHKLFSARSWQLVNCLEHLLSELGEEAVVVVEKGADKVESGEDEDDDVGELPAEEEEIGAAEVGAEEK
jgi:hypothetical protein